MAQGTPTNTIAKLFNLSPRRINQLCSEGILEKLPDGKSFDLASTVQKYVKHLQDNNNRDVDTLVNEARITQFKSEKLEIELAHLKNNMIPIQLATEAWSKVIEIIRTSIINLPRRAAPVVAGTTNASAAEKLLKELCYDILNELSNPDLSAIVEMENKKKREMSAKRSRK